MAQTTGRYTIKGTVMDSTGNKLPGATVMLLLPKDSSLVNYGRTDTEGALEFKNVKRITYLLKISYVGYLPFQQEVKPTDEAINELGTLQMKELNQDLFEVVIKTARAPLSIRGDTVEYNASSFKVPPGSTVEDLLRRLPGMQIGQDGSIQAQGEEVKRVTVDGKRFFGDDPKMATKNLPADAISKVQVFNDKSEQSRITGVDDGKREKTVNLELKDSHKKGGFGKATLGAGTDSRAEAKINYNRFNDKQQFAIVGFGNNVNQTGMSWDDYQDFRGSQSFNWGDNADFGFSSGGMYYYSSGDDESVTLQPGGGSRDRGFTKNYAGGANYNYDDKKTKLNTSYFYNQTEQTLDAFSQRENFLSNNTSFRTLNDNTRLNFNANHRGNLRFEKKLDSLNTLVIFSNGRYGQGNNRYNSLQQFYRNDGTLSNQSTINNFNQFNSFAIENAMIYRHEFRKKGRNFAASVTYNVSNSQGDGDQRSVNEFFFEGNRPDSLLNISQVNQTNSLRNVIKSSVYYIEPFAKKFFWETFYNFSYRTDEVDRDVSDRRGDVEVRNSFLSRYYTNNFTYNRLGTSVRYSHKGLNLVAGLAGQQFKLRGKYAEDQTSRDFGRIDRTFFAWIPNVSFNYNLKNNRYLRANYSVSLQEPSIRDLQPIVDNSNPLYIQIGNPDLLPQTYHNASVGYSHFNPGNFTQFFVSLNYTYNVNQIIYNQTIDENFVTTTRPTNITGGERLGVYGNYGFPLKKTKATLNVFSSLNFSNNITFINAVENQTRTDAYNVGVRLDLTPVDWLTFYPNANWNISNTRYSINTSQNQQIVNNTYGAEMNIRLPKDIFIKSDFVHRSYVNERFGFNQQIPILNMAVYKLFLKNKRGEMRLTAYDVFNQNRGITQFASQNFVSQEQIQTLARYFMLSFSYNMRGMKSTIRRQSY
ncbi:TonB-dependent receptor [Rhabdobacter roseus]|nr:outer membrane beta-barrel protein [Rhabdobacter roseus]